MLWGISPVNAKATCKVYARIAALSRRDDVVDALSAAIREGGKEPRADAVTAVADIMMSRRKWSPARLRSLAEGPRLYAALTALHGVAMGYGGDNTTLKAILKAMAEVGARRRAGTFKGVAGSVKEAANLEWWRAQ